MNVKGRGESNPLHKILLAPVLVPDLLPFPHPLTDGHGDEHPFFFTMPSASFNSYPTTPCPDSPRQSTWKSIFRMPSSSFKKTSLNGIYASPPTRLHTDSLSSSAFSSVTNTPLMPTAPLSAASYFPDQRNSYNSSDNSTDSQAGHNFEDRLPTPFPSSLRSAPFIPPTSAIRTRQHAKSTVSRLHPPIKHIPQSIYTEPSQSSCPRALPARSKTNVPLSPKSVSASASRFLRRVASAPNAKGLFSMGMRSTSTKNGLLAPNDPIPPSPRLTTAETGQDSLETVSSSSSRGARMTTSRRGPHKPMPLGPKSQQGLAPPNRIPFRRTYSSNSIKVGRVSRENCEQGLCILKAKL